MNTLPDGVQYHLLTFLSVVEITNMSATCRDFKCAAEEPFLWKEKMEIIIDQQPPNHWLKPVFETKKNDLGLKKLVILFEYKKIDWKW